MAKYQKPKMIAKNLPTGSYAAGCPTHSSIPRFHLCPLQVGFLGQCKKCETTK